MSSLQYLSTLAGYFALLNANGDQGKKARLYSPLFEKSDDTFCLNFWFSASGPHIGTLSVLKAKANDVSKKTNIWQWTTDGDNPVSDGWTQAEVPYVVRTSSPLTNNLYFISRVSKLTLLSS